MPDAQQQTKIFCIGFNKTGTSSLHEFLNTAGLSSVHNTVWPHFSRTPTGRSYFRRKADCYSDGEQADFHRLKNWFPNALFILNTRNDKAWMRSRLKHILRFNENVEIDKIFEDPRYKATARDFYFDPNAAITKWLLEKRIYEKQARTYFKDDPRFIEIDITTDKDWIANLSGFLGRNEVKLNPSGNKDIRKNVRDESKIEDEGTLDAYYRLADKIMSDLEEIIKQA